MRAFKRFVNFASRRRDDQRLREEMQMHLEFQAEEHVRAGMSAREAQRLARIKFGSIATIHEQFYAEKSLPWAETLLQDTRYALRVLRRSPSFTLVALITLMLSIAANVVVFGVINAVLLHSLDVRDPQNLYQIRHRQWSQGRLLTTSYPALQDYRQRSTTFSGFIGIDAYSSGTLTQGNTVKEVSGDEVTGNYFDLLGVEPQAGRFFHVADEHGPGSTPYIVLSDALWRTMFHRAPEAIGATVEFNKHPFTIVGVAPAQFHGTEKFTWPDYWLPLVEQEQADGWKAFDDRTSAAVTVIGRLKPGVTPQQGTDDLNTIVAELAREYPQSDGGEPLRLIHPGLLGDEGDVIRGYLWGVALLALLVLGAACANLASLFTARAADRGRELALRVALGSSRQRLVRQILTEALLLSLMGGAAGLVMAYFVLSGLNRSAPFAGVVTVVIDARVYLVALALALASAFVFGLLPARQVWRSDPMQALKGEAAASFRLVRFTLRDVLLGVQIAVCTMLVTASLVAVRGLVRTMHVPLGIQPQGVMLAQIGLGRAVPDRDVALQKQQTMIEAVRQIPGVTAVGLISRTPMTGGMHGTPVFGPGTTEFKLNNAALAPYEFQISPEYLEAAGTRLLSGRDISWHDTLLTPYVAVVNATFANRMWGNAPALGEHFILSGQLTEVVGIVEDGKYHDLQEAPQPVAYVPLPQSEDSDAIFVVRSRRTAREMTSELERTLNSIAPDAPVSVQSWTDSLSVELFPARAATVTLGAMGVLAAMLSMTGIFGMAAYNVSRRMKELGIRIALGAHRLQVMTAAVGLPLVLLAAGALAGLVAGVCASRVMRQIVYQADPGNPVILCGAALVMVLLGVAATAIPARRAVAIDPSKLMREE